MYLDCMIIVSYDSGRGNLGRAWSVAARVSKIRFCIVPWFALFHVGMMVAIYGYIDRIYISLLAMKRCDIGHLLATRDVIPR